MGVPFFNKSFHAFLPVSLVFIQITYCFYRQSASRNSDVRKPLCGHSWCTAMTVHLLTEVYCYLETFIKYLKNSLNLKVLLSISMVIFSFSWQFQQQTKPEPKHPHLTTDKPTKQLKNQPTKSKHYAAGSIGCQYSFKYPINFLHVMQTAGS
jgi:hypothetical protein